MAEAFLKSRNPVEEPSFDSKTPLVYNFEVS